VGISATTFTSERAGELAGQFARTGAKVVLGGVHPSIMPEECLGQAHAVVVGEAEYVWPGLLRDAEGGRLRRVYAAERPTEMDDVPFPRRDLLAEPAWFACVQATRGCPNSCRYCYLPSMPWRTFRKRSIELVDEELGRLAQKLVFFVDDNLFADRDYALRLFRAVARHRKTLAIQIPATLGRDGELLDAMAEAGCFNVQVGFQSFSPPSLEWAGVGQNRVEEYQTLVGGLHQRGILVTGFFIFGFDTDDLGTFDRTVEMIRRLELDDANLYILTPYPGTPLYVQMQSEGRLLAGTRRSQFGWAHAVFRPRQMSPEELERGVQRMYDELGPHFRRRAPGALLRRLGLLLRHPALVRVLLGGLARRARVAEEPSGPFTSRHRE
jgi:radical SAM superfamily enzyme YgiQ (UPF0313 family)